MTVCREPRPFLPPHPRWSPAGCVHRTGGRATTLRRRRAPRHGAEPSVAAGRVIARRGVKVRSDWRTGMCGAAALACRPAGRPPAAHRVSRACPGTRAADRCGCPARQLEQAPPSPPSPGGPGRNSGRARASRRPATWTTTRSLERTFTMGPGWSRVCRRGNGRGRARLPGSGAVCLGGERRVDLGEYHVEVVVLDASAQRAPQPLERGAVLGREALVGQRRGPRVPDEDQRPLANGPQSRPPLARIHRSPDLIHDPGHANRCPSERRRWRC
jgi:hypothetical protein